MRTHLQPVAAALRLSGMTEIGAEAPTPAARADVAARGLDAVLVAEAPGPTHDAARPCCLAAPADVGRT